MKTLIKENIFFFRFALWDKRRKSIILDPILEPMRKTDSIPQFMGDVFETRGTLDKIGQDLVAPHSVPPQVPNFSCPKSTTSPHWISFAKSENNLTLRLSYELRLELNLVFHLKFNQMEGLHRSQDNSIQLKITSLSAPIPYFFFVLLH